MYEIQNRRYIGSKTSLTPWIFDNIPKKYNKGTFVDVFAGTGVVASKSLENFNKTIINDFLYSNSTW